MIKYWNWLRGGKWPLFGPHSGYRTVYRRDADHKKGKKKWENAVTQSSLSPPPPSPLSRTRACRRGCLRSPGSPRRFSAAPHGLVGPRLARRVSAARAPACRSPPAPGGRAWCRPLCESGRIGCTAAAAPRLRQRCPTCLREALCRWPVEEVGVMVVVLLEKFDGD